MNEEIAELVVRRAPVADIREAAKANGMKELREDGLLKVLEGMTTPDEVMRVVFTAGLLTGQPLDQCSRKRGASTFCKE